MTTLRPALRRIAAVLALSTLGALGSASWAATVEFKLHPDLKGREYKSALQSLAALGTLTSNAQHANQFSVEAASSGQAKQIVQSLRESRAVLWASIAPMPLADGVEPPLATFHERVLTLRLKSGADVATVLARLARTTGQNLRLRRLASGDRAVVMLPVGTTAATLAAVSVAALNDAAVLGADRAKVLKHQWIPADPLWSQQWALADGMGGIRASAAWDIAASGSITVAVLDTGIRSHPDLDGKYVSGYDMVSDTYVSVDGDGRDADPSDPGDYFFGEQCDASYDDPSSWHGTHVAGIIAANGNNGEGVVGVAPDARVQSIRVLGRCGGLDVDVADGIRWAAGVPVAGAPVNPNPVKVMNLSLGGFGACDNDMQSAIDAAIARGASIVVSAGNSASLASFFSPANCKGVITVAASNLLGDLSSYSNYGDMVEVAAPGGDFGNQPGVLSTLNGGGTQPGVPSYAAYRGTSMAAPHVAGVIALMLARDPSLTPSQVLSRLQASSRSFPVGADCAEAVGACGAGLLDAANAVAAVALNRGVNEASGRADRTHLVELVNTVHGRYTLSADPVEVTRLVASGWSRTGYLIPTYSFTAIGQQVATPQPVCRAKYLGHEFVTFSANVGECKTYAASPSMQADGMVFVAALPNANVCPNGSVAAWELVRLEAPGLYNARTLTDWQEINRMLSLPEPWVPSRVAFCAPN